VRELAKVGDLYE